MKLFVYARPLKKKGRVGGAEEDRTPDLRIANATLSQLSYGPKRRVKCPPNNEDYKLPVAGKSTSSEFIR